METKPQLIDESLRNYGKVFVLVKDDGYIEVKSTTEHTKTVDDFDVSKYFAVLELKLNDYAHNLSLKVAKFCSVHRLDVLSRVYGLFSDSPAIRVDAELKGLDHNMAFNEFPLDKRLLNTQWMPREIKLAQLKTIIPMCFDSRLAYSEKRAVLEMFFNYAHIEYRFGLCTTPIAIEEERNLMLKTRTADIIDRLRDAESTSNSTQPHLLYGGVLTEGERVQLRDAGWICESMIDGGVVKTLVRR